MYKKDFVYELGTSSTDLGNQKIFYTIIFASVVMAILFGLFAVTANPIIISLAVALIAGTVLLAKPVWIIWLILFLGLSVTGVLQLFLENMGTRSSWGVSILGIILMFIAFFRILTSPGILKSTPAFIWVALIFLVYALLNSLMQWHSMYEFYSGFKRYFQVWGLLFALCWLPLDKKDIHRWQMFIVVVALLQLPFAVYELIVYVPLREGLSSSIPLMVPIDVVAGTFGASLTGGGSSSEMATFLIIFLAFLLSRHMEKSLSIGRLILLTPLVLAPLFLGETKAVIIMLPLMFLVLYYREVFIRLHYWLLGLIVVIVLTVAAGYAYMSLSNKAPDEFIHQVVNYNFGEKGHGGNKLNRTTVISYWANRQGIHDPISFMFGNGMGASHDATGGHVSKQHPGYGIGLTAAATLLWDMGVFGSALFVTILVLAWGCAAQLRRESVVPEVRADAAAIQTALAIFAFYLFYRLGVLESLSFQVVFVMLLGYLAWLYRMHVLVERRT